MSFSIHPTSSSLQPLDLTQVSLKEDEIKQVSVSEDQKMYLPTPSKWAVVRWFVSLFARTNPSTIEKIEQVIDAELSKLSSAGSKNHINLKEKVSKLGHLKNNLSSCCAAGRTNSAKEQALFRQISATIKEVENEIAQQQEEKKGLMRDASAITEEINKLEKQIEDQSAKLQAFNLAKSSAEPSRFKEMLGTIRSTLGRRTADVPTFLEQQLATANAHLSTKKNELSQVQKELAIIDEKLGLRSAKADALASIDGTITSKNQLLNVLVKNLLPDSIKDSHNRPLDKTMRATTEQDISKLLGIVIPPEENIAKIERQSGNKIAVHLKWGAETPAKFKLTGGPIGSLEMANPLVITLEHQKLSFEPEALKVKLGMKITVKCFSTKLKEKESPEDHKITLVTNDSPYPWYRMSTKTIAEGLKKKEMEDGAVSNWIQWTPMGK